ncbi:hypothetical protein ATO12_19655 [Aquimarina atlantica]|uniref:Bacteriocin n=1 Tax=Aquimarina atlantica TaxID=1317122 RepID=A0A023BT87_9FLAO|nr:hypothetical protein ATO12_19655 [Aquimarina atlantica]
MKNTLLNLGKSLSRTEQKQINGGGPCDGYNGPTIVTCSQYEQVPPQYQICVRVSVDCFPH